MPAIDTSTFVRAAAAVVLTLAVAAAAPAQEPVSYSELPSETPALFEPVTGDFDHVRREVMIPMRDWVRLFTVIFVPKGAENAPILLTCSPAPPTTPTR